MNILLTTNSIKAPLTGIGRYTYELAKGLANADLVEQLFGYSHGHFFKYQTCDLADLTSVKTTRDRLKSISSLHFLRQFYHVLDGWRLRQKIRDVKIDVYHSPNFLLYKTKIPSVATISDLSHIHYATFHMKHHVRHLKKNLADTIRRAAHLITISSYIRDEVVDYFKISPEKISVVPLGVSEHFKWRSCEMIQNTLDFYGLRYKNYFLSVATLEPRKNFSTLIKSFLQLPEDIQSAFPLVLVGGSGWLNSDLYQKILPLQRQGKIKYLGYLSDAALYEIYSGARAFVLPSFYEGFGLPVLEAMASGVPVLSSNVSSIPEVTQGAALLIDPNQSEMIAEKLKLLAEDGILCEKLSCAGLEVAKTFTWEKCVDLTLQVYQKVI